MSCPRIKLSNSQTLILDGVETLISLLGFAEQLRRKNAEVPDIYFILLEAVGISPTLILNHNAKAKKRKSWTPFKVWTSDAAEAVHTGWCCLWVCALLSETYQSVNIKGETIFAFKNSYTKFTLATRKFKQLKAIARFKTEN